MSEDFLRTQLATQLNRLDWSAGIAKPALIDQLGADPPGQKAIGRALADGVYFSPADVLTALPAGAWQEPPPPPVAAARTGNDAMPPLPEPLSQIPAPVAAGVVGGLALAGFAAGVGWLLRRRRQE